jgi:hypothetical protein
MKKLVAQQLDEVLAQAAVCPGLACERQLRVGAATLTRADSTEITATTVVGTIGRGEHEALEDLVEAIAKEFAIQARVRFGAASFSVRFSRPTEFSDPTQPVGAAGSLSAWTRFVSGVF